ncbi:heavy-metal-associated domain-containing protein [Arthrobacter cryoconiti]|uniref:Heavy-metal-associated domain-containing protein n=1 Tax=Arthrobacter cryoconiti TaxID=748907 RepID=A0ABV8R5C6_9MICC|nr:heavy-metal-associated domain-containing protein [Arthrobacter cryoconiti]MCC9069388.1 heavy-metal-associated domain-containing protein [Arthrobacter cryoconiti]
MCGTELNEATPAAPAATLPLAESPCACCSTAEAPAAPVGFDSAAATTSYQLEGLTCGHCVQSVETAASRVLGVKSATVELVTGGSSILRIAGPAAPSDIQAAVVEAGYAVAPA